MRSCDLQKDTRWDREYNRSLEKGEVKKEMKQFMYPGPDSQQFRLAKQRKNQLSEKNRKRGRTNRRVKGK